MLSLTLATIGAVRDYYLRFAAGDTIEVIESQLTDLEHRLEMVNEAHEAFLYCAYG